MYICTSLKTEQRRPAGQGFSFFAMTACFSSSTPVCNVFCSELAVFSAKGNSVKRSFSLALAASARILGESEFFISSSLPKTETFEGFISINGQKKSCYVRFNANMGLYPEVF